MMSDSNLPNVTIAIPAFNEEAFIEDTIKIFQQSAYPNIIEILIADGRSTDRTAAIVRRISEADPRVKLVDNPDKIQSAGLNRLIAQAKGELFLRADAHCEYAADYVEASVQAHHESGALNVGGPQRFVARNNVQVYIANAVDNIFGSGGARYRDKEYAGFADTVFLGCYRTDVLKRLKGYLVDNVTNEDAELNIRLEKEQRNAVYISPDIRVWYYPRGDFLSLFKQYVRYGKGRCLTVFRHSAAMSFRGSTPFLTIFTLLIILITLLLSGHVLFSAGLAAAILLIVFTTVIQTVTKNRKRINSEIWRGPPGQAPGWLKQVFGTFFVILTINLAHFLGYGWQILRFLAGKKSW